MSKNNSSRWTYLTADVLARVMESKKLNQQSSYENVCLSLVYQYLSKNFAINSFMCRAPALTTKKKIEVIFFFFTL